MPTKAIANSGCSSHFLSATAPCNRKQATLYGLTVGLPNGTAMKSTHTALLPFPQLPLAARQSTIFPSLGNWSLLSIGQFCDSGFQHVHLIKDNVTILGHCAKTDGLYYIDLSSSISSSPLSPPAPIPMVNFLPHFPKTSYASNVYSMATEKALSNI